MKELLAARGTIFILFLLMVLLAFFSLWQQTQMFELSLRLEQISSVKQEEIQAQKQLLIEAESLSSLDRIELLARKMGLDLPQSGQIIVMRDSHADG